MQPTRTTTTKIITTTTTHTGASEKRSQSSGTVETSHFAGLAHFGRMLEDAHWSHLLVSVDQASSSHWDVPPFLAQSAALTVILVFAPDAASPGRALK